MGQNPKTRNYSIGAECLEASFDGFGQVISSLEASAIFDMLVKGVLSHE